MPKIKNTNLISFPITLADKKRFIKSVQRHYQPLPGIPQTHSWKTCCWHFVGNINHFSLTSSIEAGTPGNINHFPLSAKSITVNARDFAFLAFIDPILYIDTTIIMRCKRPRCVNPLHMKIKVRYNKNKLTGKLYPTKNKTTELDLPDPLKKKLLDKLIHQNDHICYPGKRPSTRINGKNISNNRLYYILLYGPIPENMLLVKQCDQPNCINPYHQHLISKEQLHKNGNGVNQVIF